MSLRDTLKRAIQTWHDGREAKCAAWAEGLWCCCDAVEPVPLDATEWTLDRAGLNELLDVILGVIQEESKGPMVR